MFTTILFYVLALVLVVSAARVVMAASPVAAALNLILAFFTAAMLWMTYQQMICHQLSCNVFDHHDMMHIHDD